MDLGGDDDGFAAGIGLEEFADDALAVAAGVDIGRIEKVDAEVEGLAQEGLALFFIERPEVASGFRFVRCGWAAIGHAAEADAGDFHSCMAEIYVVHQNSSIELIRCGGRRLKRLAALRPEAFRRSPEFRR